MANMSYCRFENTARDLRDCIEALEEGTFLEGYELSGYENIMELAQYLVEQSPKPLENQPEEWEDE